MIRRLALILLASSPLPAEDAKLPFLRQEPAATLKSPAVAEASGLAASPTHPDLLWVINDSGSAAELHRAGIDGSDRGKVAVRGVRNTDWEDLASFVLDGKSYLLIADTGDNRSARPECQLHVVAEPQAGDKAVTAAWTIRFTYEDGPRDCEAVAVDEAAQKIVLLSKRTNPPVLYELPLRPEGTEARVGKRIGTLGNPLPAGTPPVPFGTQPTGLAIARDGKSAAVVTYWGVFLFARTPTGSWADAFARLPVGLEPHALQQAESISFSRDGTSLLTVSEGGGSPVLRYRRKD